MMNETVPWNWQDTATLIGCVSMLFLAFWIRRRLIKSKPGGCSSGGCGTGSETSGAAKVIIPTTSLSIGKRQPRPGK